MTGRRLRVALCYADDDGKSVAPLASRLANDGFQVSDVGRPRPGQKVRREKEKMIRDSDAAILCLSQHSVGRRGTLQKDIHRVLEVQDEQPEDVIYLIPALLEPMALPWQLEKWQAVELFAPDGYARLRESLRKSERELHEESGPQSGGGVDSASVRYDLGRISPPVDPDLFVGRSAQLEWLDRCWNDPEIHLAQIVADGGVGKSALVWHWLEKRRKAKYEGVAQAIDWSFYSQGKRDYETDSHAFLDAAADHFYPTGIGLPQESQRRPDRMGALIAQAFLRDGGLIVFDGLEPLQYSPLPPTGGALKDPGIVSFTRTVRTAPPPPAGAPRRLVVITTRWAVPALRGSSVSTLNLDNLQPSDGADLLSRFRLPLQPERALRAGPHKEEALRLELENVSRELNGHALALLLLASFVLKKFRGDVRKRAEFMGTIETADDEDGPYRHARRVMQSYDRLFEESGKRIDGACRKILFMVGLFDRPVRSLLIDVVRQGEPIEELTDDLPDNLFETALETLRALRLLTAIPDETNDQLDTHPLIREHFGQVLRQKYRRSWQQVHRRLFELLCKIGPDAPERPGTVEKLEPLLQAVAHGCEAGLYHQSYNDVYRSRIMRGGEAFATRALGLFSPIVTCLSHFFERGGWSRVITGGEPGNELTPAERVSLLIEAGTVLTAVQGYASMNVKAAYDAAIELSRQHDRQHDLITAYYGLWRWALVKGDFAVTTPLAQELTVLAARSHDPVDHIGSARVRCTTHYYRGEYSVSILAGNEGLRGWERTPAAARAALNPELLIMCLSSGALALWHLGFTDQAFARSAKSIAHARDLDASHTLVIALLFDSWLCQFSNDVNAAHERAEEMSNLCEERGLGSMAHLAMAMYALALARETGYDEKHLREMQDSMDGWMQAGGELLVPYCRYWLADCRSMRGEDAKAMVQLDRAIDSASTRQEKWWLPECHRSRALLSLRMERSAADIAADLTQALSIATQTSSVALLHRILDTLETLPSSVRRLLSEEVVERARQVLLRPRPAVGDISFA